MAQALIKAPPEGRLGPAMQALNERQRLFVIALLELGDDNHKRAAIAAGYSGNDNTLRVCAHRLAHDDKVQAALIEEARRRLTSASILAVSTLIDIIRGGIAGSTVKDRTKAIELLLNRTGLHALTEHKIDVHHTSDEGAVERLMSLSKALNLDPKQLLGSIGMQVVDGEFTEVMPSNASKSDLDPSEHINDPFAFIPQE